MIDLADHTYQPTEYGSLGIRCFRGPPERMPQDHTHSEIELNFLEHGRMSYDVMGQERVIEPHALYVFSGVLPHRVTFRDYRTTMCWITLPAPYLTNWQLSQSFLDRLFAGQVFKSTGQRAETMDHLQVVQWIEDIETKDPVRLRLVVLEIQARLARMALAHDAGSGADPAASDRRQREAAVSAARMTSFIFGNLASEIRLDDIAGAAGLHKNYAIRLFKNRTGQTPIAFLTEQRLIYAKYLLATTDRKVIEVALDCGFGSISRFYEVFEKATGTTPSDFRKQARRQQGDPAAARHLRAKIESG